MTLAIRTVADLGFAVGTADAGMREASKPFHQKFVNAKPEVQDQMRYDFRVNYVRGLLRVDHAKATAIVDAGKRTDNAKHNGAVNSANAMCTKWLVNGGGDKASAGHAKGVKITADQLAALRALDALCATYGDMRAVCNAYITKAQGK